MQPKIAILLSTYNGQSFLAEQLESLLRQSYGNFIVVVRDDGSDDDSIAIAEKFRTDHPQKFHICEDAATNLGASSSFSKLVQYTLNNKLLLGLDTAYMAFCDQDDVWHENKLARSTAAMFAAEESGEAMPVLVHTDLRVVDETGNSIAGSFMAYQGLTKENNTFPKLVLSNLVTGCTALINEELARRSIPVDHGAIMHDWWLALVASAFGKLVYLDQPLMDYRQHGSNTIGAKEHKSPRRSLRLIIERLFDREPDSHLHEVARQATVFLSRYASSLSQQQIIALEIASELRSNSRREQAGVCRKLRAL